MRVFASNHSDEASSIPHGRTRLAPSSPRRGSLQTIVVLSRGATGRGGTRTMRRMMVVQQSKDTNENVGTASRRATHGVHNFQRSNAESAPTRTWSARRCTAGSRETQKSTVKTLAVKRANEFCANKGKTMVLTGSQSSGVQGWTPQNSEVTFTCADAPAK